MTIARRGRRAALFALGAGLAVVLAAPSAFAQAYPNRTIKIVVGFAAGGGNDIIARIIGDKLQTSMGQPVIIENKVGAGGRLAAEMVMGSPPDGYTLLVGASGAMSIIPAISVKPPYDATKNFAPISQIAAFPLIFATYADHPAKNIQEFIAWMKANPDKSNFATSSPAFTLATELFKLKTGAPGTAIPYKSSNESLVSVIGQQAQFTIVDPPPTAPLVKGGQARALAVLAKTRSPDLPDVPTMTEAGVPDVNVSLWSGLFAPAGTPAPVIQRLEAEMMKIMRMPDVREKFLNMATPPTGTSAAEFTRIIDIETKMYGEIGKAANVKLE